MELSAHARAVLGPHCEAVNVDPKPCTAYNRVLAAIHFMGSDVEERILARSVLKPPVPGPSAAALLAAEIEHRAPSVVVEIGTFHGASIALLALLAPTARVITVDIKAPSVLAVELWRALELTGRIQTVLGTAATLPPDLSIDFAFVDGDHRAPGVAADLGEILPRLSPRATLVFDDLTHSGGAGLVIRRLAGLRDCGRMGVVRLESVRIES